MEKRNTNTACVVRAKIDLDTVFDAILTSSTLRAVVSSGRTLRFDGKETTASNRLLFHRACASTWWLRIVSLRNRTAERRGRQIACAWRTWQGYNLRILSWSWLTSMFSCLVQKDLFKRKWSLAKSYFKQNYCHACHTRFAVFFPLPSCCVSFPTRRRQRERWFVN